MGVVGVGGSEALGVAGAAPFPLFRFGRCPSGDSLASPIFSYSKTLSDCVTSFSLSVSETEVVCQYFGCTEGRTDITIDIGCCSVDETDFAGLVLSESDSASSEIYNSIEQCRM